MKIVGLITEYNPFHNGHKYHIEKAKEISGADYVIAVMSGNFVQRGTPAFLPKHLRASMALECGCDLIIELPVSYSTGSAEFFASGAVSILDKLGCVDTLCFGSECGNYEILERIADVLLDEPDEFRFCLQEYLRQGFSFPYARQTALEYFFHDEFFDAVLEKPNNILGIEYIKALKTINSNIKGCTISRKDSSYHDDSLSETYSSASAIRAAYTSESLMDFDILQGHVPEEAVNILISGYQIRYPVYADDFSLILRYRLMTETKESLTQYLDISQDFANRIINLRNEFLSFSQFCNLLKTKELTHARISRCLMHILLNICKSDYREISYAHILGFRKASSELFSVIKHSAKIPIITKLTSIESLDISARNMLNQDIYASDLYENIISHKYQKPFINELTQQIIKKGAVAKVDK